MDECPLCGSSSIFYDPARSEYYCSKCGCVIDYDQVFDYHELIQAKRDIENARFELRKAKDDNYNYAISEIRRIATNLDLPSYIVREAEVVYFKLKKKGYIGHNYNTIEALASACLLFSAYEFNYDLAFEDVCNISKEEPDKIRSMYLKVFTIFNSNTAKTNTYEGGILQEGNASVT